MLDRWHHRWIWSQVVIPASLDSEGLRHFSLGFGYFERREGFENAWMGYLWSLRAFDLDHYELPVAGFLLFGPVGVLGLSPFPSGDVFIASFSFGRRPLCHL